MDSLIDINENLISIEILKILLLDRTTNENIMWATSDYEYLGKEYNSHNTISIESITGKNSNIIIPRVLKSKKDKTKRTKKRAEVFTPSWVCNEQCNLVDHSWFKREPIFNIANTSEHSWIATKEKIEFPENNKNRTWQAYVSENRLEITCGEAPYLVSRYDAVSGIVIPITERIGFLDRKLRIVSENTDNEEDWLKWCFISFESIYGFELQGDNLLLARENILLTFIDYVNYYLKREPTQEELKKIAIIASWNMWQMDGLTLTIPYEEGERTENQPSLFDCVKEDKNVFCVIKDWKDGSLHKFLDLTKGIGLDKDDE